VKELEQFVCTQQQQIRTKLTKTYDDDHHHPHKRILSEASGGDLGA